MRIHVLMITYNRPRYVAISLPRLCASLPEDARLVVWDNASQKETRDILRQYEKHPRVAEIHYNESNAKLRGPTNWFWEKYGNAELLSKVDDDCLMPLGWCETLTKAHADIPEAGALGCWRFPEEDFVPEVAKKKIVTHAGHQLMRNCWVEGSGYLMKSRMQKQLGPLQDKESFPAYCIRGAAAGYIHGWYYPFLFQDHFDDPRSPHTDYTSEEAFQSHRPLSAGTFSIETLEGWKNRLRHSARSLQEYSYDPSDFVGPKATIKKAIARLFRKEYLPRTR
jgi:glycosyltransferase involved in cell wall biosynthesis